MFWGDQIAAWRLLSLFSPFGASSFRYLGVHRKQEILRPGLQYRPGGPNEFNRSQS